MVLIFPHQAKASVARTFFPFLVLLWHNTLKKLLSSIYPIWKLLFLASKNSNPSSTLCLPSNLTSFCFDPFQFVITPNICASIQTIQDWDKKVGASTVLDSGCRSDLEDLTACDGCVAAGFRVQQQLIAIDGNASHSTDCFYFNILYAAGIVNEFGPESTGAMSCIFSIDLKINSSSSKRHLALIFVLAGAGIAVLCMSLVLGLYIGWKKKWRKNDDVEEMEDMVSRRRIMRPNTAVWFKIQELEKATDNFS
ncbi:hypothetical protein K7X08_036634 [Anisodus acutangulus]|uniref:SPARK domain-containing protein n=1 Tax=Anisodus acutangulus TaxID=402998 RepID=A0A9Q1L9Z5_9SOLA|nr:hypothetical protein K7X08_036634 [Anisodus acutangulus]